MGTRVSILIAAYNIEMFIDDCLYSAINQTYKNIEIIVVNDGSTDNTKIIIEKYLKENSNLKLINQENGGLVSARKAGVENAKGDFVFFLDGDDTIPHDAIENLVCGINENTDIVVANYSINRNKYSKVVKSYGFISGNKFDLLTNIYKNSLCNLWGNLYSITLFKDFKFPLELYKSIGEDLVIITYLILNSKGTIEYINETTYNYEIRSNSIIGSVVKESIWGQGFNAFLLTSNILDKFIAKEKVKLGYLKLLDSYVVGYIMSNRKISDYKPGLITSLKYAKKNKILYKKEMRPFNYTIMIIAYYNIFISRFIGRFSLKKRNYFNNIKSKM